MESSSSPSSDINDVLTRFMTSEQPTVFQNGVEVTSSSLAYLGIKEVVDSKALAAELCHHFYSLGWFSGIGGSIAIKVHDDSIPKPAQLIVMSPSGIFSLSHGRQYVISFMCV